MVSLFRRSLDTSVWEGLRFGREKLGGEGRGERKRREKRAGGVTHGTYKQVDGRGGQGVRTGKREEEVES